MSGVEQSEVVASAESSPRELPDRDRVSHFLASVVAHGLTTGHRRASDFVAHLSARDIMQSLASRVEERARLLEASTGIKRSVARRKSPEAAAADLDLALTFGEVDAATIVEAFAVDNLFHLLGIRALWAYLAECETDPAASLTRGEALRAKTHLMFVLETALAEGIVSHEDIVEVLGARAIVAHLTNAELSGMLSRVFALGGADSAFTPMDALAVVPPASFVQLVRWKQVWDSMLVPKLGEWHRAPGTEIDEADFGREDSQIATMPHLQCRYVSADGYGRGRQ